MNFLAMLWMLIGFATMDEGGTPQPPPRVRGPGGDTP